MRRVRIRLGVWIGLLVVATVAFATVAWPRDGGNPFRSYADAPLVAGEGLGDLRLGATELGAFVTRYGVGRPAAVYGDDTALEFAFARPGLTFTFAAEGACARVVQGMAGTGLRALRSPRDFVRDHPDCVAAPLASIAVDAARTARGSFWRGATPSGVRLHQGRDEALAHLGVDARDFDDDAPAPDRWFDTDGLLVTFGPAADTDAEARPSWVVSRLEVVPRR
jgi:hypothetical protein